MLPPECNCKSINFEIVGCPIHGQNRQKEGEGLNGRDIEMFSGPSSDGLGGPTPAESVNKWADMIDEAKDRGAVNDLSSIAYRLMVICATGGFKAR